MKKRMRKFRKDDEDRWKRETEQARAARRKAKRGRAKLFLDDGIFPLIDEQPFGSAAKILDKNASADC